MAVVLSMTTPISLPDMVGILCGATTNTPALGAAQQTLKQLGEPTSGAALSCAVTYPLGVVGVILLSSLSESSSYARLTCRSMNTTTPTTRTLLLSDTQSCHLQQEHTGYCSGGLSQIRHLTTLA